MVFDLVKRGFGQLRSSVARFLGRSFSVSMGCLFACFRSRRRVLQSSGVKEVAESSNRSSSLLQEQFIASPSGKVNERENISNSSSADDVGVEFSKLTEDVLSPSLVVLTEAAPEISVPSTLDQKPEVTNIEDSNSKSLLSGNDQLVCKVVKLNIIPEKGRVLNSSEVTPSSYISSGDSDVGSSSFLVNDSTEESLSSISVSISNSSTKESDNLILPNIDLGTSTTHDESESNLSNHIHESPTKANVLGQDTSTTTEVSIFPSSEQASASSKSSNSSAIDRPIIIGMLDAHWHCIEATDIRQKWWNGNGIPNSTTKYKEDQKVKWHATPFEERLEKALYQDSPKKKNIKGRPLTYDGCEEDETSLPSKIVSSHSASVESF